MIRKIEHNDNFKGTSYDNKSWICKEKYIDMKGVKEAARVMLYNCEHQINI